jgi:DNA-binding transcriptional LysR family regulator
MISSSDLTYFIEIAQAQNLSRASERLGISQPALSLAVQRIEQSLKTQVLIRSKKGVSLTRAGLKLLAHTKTMLQYWDQVKVEAKSSVDEVNGTLTLGCHPSVGLYTLDRFLPNILKNFPKLEISLVHDLSRKITEQVISLEVDIGLVINPVRHPQLIIKNLLEDTVSLWVSKHTDKPSEENILICDPSLLQTQHIIKDLKKSRIHFSRILTSSSLENIANLTASGVGIGVLPCRVAECVAGDRIVPVRSAPKFKDTLAVIYRMENRGIKSFQCLVGEIAKVIK